MLTKLLSTLLLVLACWSVLLEQGEEEVLSQYPIFTLPEVET